MRLRFSGDLNIEAKCPFEIPAGIGWSRAGRPGPLKAAGQQTGEVSWESLTSPDRHSTNKGVLWSNEG